jgi:spore maturation protein CgeB
MQIQQTINPETVSIYNNGEYIGDITNRNTFFEAIHKNGMKAVFSTFDAAKKLFEEVVKPNTIKQNNQINLF